MKDYNKIDILTAFNPFLRLLQAYNADNFIPSKRIQIVQNLCFAFGVTGLISVLPASMILTIWYFFDDTSTMKNIVVAAQILTVLQMLINAIALVLKNCDVTKTIGRLQEFIDCREYLLFLRLLIYDSLTRKTYFELFVQILLSELFNHLHIFINTGCEESNEPHIILKINTG